MPCGWGFVPSASFDLHCHIDKSKPTLYLLQLARVCHRLNSGYGLKSFPGAEYSTLSFANAWKHSASEFLQTRINSRKILNYMCSLNEYIGMGVAHRKMNLSIMGT